MSVILNAVARVKNPTLPLVSHPKVPTYACTPLPVKSFVAFNNKFIPVLKKNCFYFAAVFCIVSTVMHTSKMCK